MSDLLERVLGEVRSRLDESRRAVEEYERLERALAALDKEPVGAGDAPAPRRPRAAAPRGQAVANRERLLSVIGERPGVTREELRAATGLSGASIAQGLRRAVAAGRVREEALPGGQTGFSLLPEDATPAAPQPATGDEPPDTAEPAAATPAAPESEPEAPAGTAEPDADGSDVPSEAAADDAEAPPRG